VHHNHKTDILQSKSNTTGGSMVYPYWHPSGKYCAYSTNETRQSFHVIKEELIEVFDLKSDVFVYCPDSKELILDSMLMTKDNFETYPAFSPDGKTLYFCSSKAYDIPENYKKVQYNLCKVGFDDGKLVGKIDTVFDAVKINKNCTFAKPSYDGKYIMFTLSDYGCFPIWHHEADLWLLDLQTNTARPMGARVRIGLSLFRGAKTVCILNYFFPASTTTAKPPNPSSFRKKTPWNIIQTRPIHSTCLILRLKRLILIITKLQMA